MNEILNRIANMKANQWLMLGGFAMAFISFTSGVAGVEVVDGMQYLGFAGGIVLILVGAMMAVNLSKHKGIEKVMELDAELRKEKLEAGLDPKKDKTIYKA